MKTLVSSSINNVTTSSCDEKQELVAAIKDIVSRYGRFDDRIVMAELQVQYCPDYKAIKGESHTIVCLLRDAALIKVCKLNSFTFNVTPQTYTVNYEELQIDTLKGLKKALDYGIFCEFIDLTNYAP